MNSRNFIYINCHIIKPLTFIKRYQKEFYHAFAA